MTPRWLFARQIRKPERKAAYYVAGGSHEVVESGTTVTHKTYIGGAAVVIETTPAPASAETIHPLHEYLGSTGVIDAADVPGARGLPARGNAGRSSHAHVFQFDDL